MSYYDDHEEKRKLGALKNTSRKEHFKRMKKVFPDRVNIVAEGDSWFAYPKKWFVFGPPSNLVDHISDWTHHKANFYSIANNGDEVVDMLSGDQKHDLIETLKDGTKDGIIDMLLFSGGGNDIVGENDFERFLISEKMGNDSQSFVNMDRLKRKCKQIALTYQELVDICEHYSPKTIIVTHTYDYPYPGDGAEFLGGLIELDSEMKKYMDKINIPDKLQTGVIKIFIDTMAEEMLKIGKDNSNIVVVDTRGTLTGKKDWLNEIHPNSDGFKLIGEIIFKEMKRMFPRLI